MAPTLVNHEIPIAFTIDATIGRGTLYYYCTNLRTFFSADWTDAVLTTDALRASIINH